MKSSRHESLNFEMIRIAFFCRINYLNNLWSAQEPKHFGNDIQRVNISKTAVFIRQGQSDSGLVNCLYPERIWHASNYQYCVSQLQLGSVLWKHSSKFTNILTLNLRLFLYGRPFYFVFTASTNDLSIEQTGI